MVVSMAADQFVDGDGHISDDSDFYGTVHQNATRDLC